MFTHTYIQLDFKSSLNLVYSVSLTQITHFRSAVYEVKYCTNRVIYYLHFFVASDFWIGGKKDNGTFKWFTSDGQTTDMKYTRFAHEESEYIYMCVELWEYFQYKWYNYKCDLKYNFICKTYF